MAVGTTVGGRPKHRRKPRGDSWMDGKPAIRMTRWMPHEPSQKQHAFLWLNIEEALYGGAAGGGKSDALLLAALQYVDVPGYSAILFRRTVRDLELEGALIPRSKEWLKGTDAVWHEQRKRWDFPSGATLQFGYLKDADSKYSYQSAEFQFIGFDELTQFSEDDYTYLFSRLRQPEVNDTMPRHIVEQRSLLAAVPLRMRSASNPGGRGHRWVSERFPVRSGHTPGMHDGRVFIPAKLTDNRYINQGSYRRSLSQLDEQTRQQLEEGDWEARGPGHWMLDHLHLDACFRLGHELDKLLDLGRMPPPKSVGYDFPVINGGIDWGEITQSYAIWELPSGGIYIAPSEVVSAHREPGEVAEEILEAHSAFGYPLGEERYDAAGVQSMRTFVATARKRPRYAQLRSVKIPFGNYKVETIKYMRFLAQKSFRAQHAEIIPNQILAISPRNTELGDQIYEWERKVTNLGEETEEAVKQNDHGPDACVAGIAPIARRHRDRVDAELAKAQQQVKVAA